MAVVKLRQNYDTKMSVLRQGIHIVLYRSILIKESK